MSEISDLEAEARTLTTEITGRRLRLQALSKKHREFRDKIDEITAKSKMAKAQYHELKQAPVIIMDEYDMACFSIAELDEQRIDSNQELKQTERQIKEFEQDVRVLESTLARITREMETFGKIVPFKKS